MEDYIPGQFYRAAIAALRPMAEYPIPGALPPDAIDSRAAASALAAALRLEAEGDLEKAVELLATAVALRHPRAAHRLAAGFNHEWGFTLSEDDLAEMASWEGLISPEAIRDAVAEVRSGGPGGIDMPEVVDGGIVRHETTTGRLTWEVRASGLVDISVYRSAQDGPALVARCLPGEGGKYELVTLLHSGSIEVRHFEELYRALKCLASESEPSRPGTGSFW